MWVWCHCIRKVTLDRCHCAMTTHPLTLQGCSDVVVTWLKSSLGGIAGVATLFALMQVQCVANLILKWYRNTCCVCVFLICGVHLYWMCFNMCALSLNVYCIHCGVHWHMGVSELYAYCSMCTCAHVRVRYLSRVRTVFVCSCTHCTHHVLKCVVTRGLAWSFLCRLLVLLCPALWPYTKALRTNIKWCSRHERSSQTIQLACCVLLS